MSDFETKWRGRMGKLDRQFGERILILPQSAGSYVAGGGDPDRPPFEVVGVLDLPPTIARSEGRGARNGSRADIVVEAITVDFAEAAFANRAAWPKKGDVLRALDRTGNPEFEVVAVEPSGLGRVAFKVVRSNLS